MGGPDGEPGRDYVRARVAAGLGLVGLVVALAILDALSATFSLDSIALGLLLGASLLFLGVEAGRKFIK